MAEYLKIGGKAVLFNPAEYSISTTAVYTGSNHKTEVTAVNRKALEVELFFDTTATGGEDVSVKMDKILPSGKAVELLWGGKPIGSGDVKTWYLNGFEKSVTKFSEDGVSIRGFLHLVFQHEELAKPQGSAAGKRAANPMKVQLSWSDGKANQSLAAVYNPASYRIYDAGMLEGSHPREQSFGRGKHHLELTLFFDAAGYDQPGDLKKDTGRIAGLIKPLDGSKKKPGRVLPEAKLDFGAAKPLKGLSTSKARGAGKWYLVKLVERYSKFDEAGEPLRANLDLTFVEA